MKLRTKVKRLKAENERLKAMQIKPFKVHIGEVRRPQKLTVTTSVHNDNLNYDFEWIDSSVRNNIKNQLADSIVDYVEITTYPDKSSPTHTIYRGELWLYIPEVEE